jgi:hypothetical protein
MAIYTSGACVERGGTELEDVVGVEVHEDEGDDRIR